MHKYKFLFYVLFVVEIVSLWACSHTNQDWSVSITGITSSSSPSLIDLTQDGILDIVMGAGGEEWQTTNKGVVALDGVNGNLLWTSSARNQVVGTAIFQDITGDGIPDVFIGGRSAELQAINGKTGIKIWAFDIKQVAQTIKGVSWYNFYNPQWIPDQDQDGLQDLLICNGGNAILPAGALHRPAGRLVIFSSKTGKVLAEDFMPDGQETYFSPLSYDDGDNPTVIFGSGGETRPGHLYICKLTDVKNKQLKNAKVLDSTTTKGYIAPPVLVDMNHDKVKDIMFNNSEGRTKLIDGKTHQVIWQVQCDSAEVYSQPGIGNFVGNDNVLDVFVTYAIGTYPYYKRVEQWLIDGKTGKIVKKYHQKRFSYASSLTADLDQDGNDEAIMTMTEDSVKNDREKPFYEIRVFDFKKNNTYTLGKRQEGACFATTPWLGDIDADGRLDLIYSGSPATTSEYPGSTAFQKPPLQLNIHRLKLEQYPAKCVKWGSYMGKNARSHWE